MKNKLCGFTMNSGNAVGILNHFDVKLSQALVAILMFCFVSISSYGRINRDVKPDLNAATDDVKSDVDACLSAADLVPSACNPPLIVSAGPDEYICRGTCTILYTSAQPGINYYWYKFPDVVHAISTSISISVCPTSTTCYLLVGENAAGCQQTDVVCITVFGNIDDGNCSTFDACDPLTLIISHTPINFNDSDACTIDYCDPLTGLEKHDYVPGCCDTLNPRGTERVINGDFASGNTGFNSDIPVNCVCSVGSICVVANAQNKCPGFYSVTDHSHLINGTPPFNYLLVDGIPQAPADVWSSVIGNIKMNRNYIFSFWIHPRISNASGNPDIQLLVKDQSNSSVLFNVTGTTMPDQWTHFTGSWTATHDFNAASLIIRQTNSSNPIGFDYGIDDISFSSCQPDCADSLINDSLLLNTGYDHIAGVSYATNQSDGGWTVINTPANISFPKPYSAWTIPAHPGWHAAFSGSQWISAYNHYTNRYNNPFPDSAYSFEYCFCLCQADSVTIDFNALADDAATFYLEENPDIYIGSTSSFQVPQHIYYRGLLQAGQHCIRADVRNLQSVAMGLNISGTVKAGNLMKWQYCDGVKPIITGPVDTLQRDTTLAVAAVVVNPTCPGANNGSLNVSVTGGTPPYYYFWNNGATTFNIYALTAGSYTVTVIDNMGNEVVQTSSVTDPAVSIPGNITGSVVSACLPAVYTVAAYSIPAVPGAVYQWTVPIGMDISSGQGTNSIVVNFSNVAIGNGIGGSLCVNIYTECGVQNSCIAIDINAVKPVTPGSISGPAKVCPGDAAVYSVAKVARASFYIWTVPVGMTITGASTNNVVTVNVDGGFTGGSLQVAAANVCGVSTVRSKPMSLNVPAMPGQISGPASGVCELTNAIYMITSVANASAYNWSVVNGTASGSNTGLNYTVNWQHDSIASVSVASVNGCGVSTARTLAVTVKPSTPSIINGSTTVCTSGIYNYSIASVAGATSYNWLLPSGASLLSGAGTKTIDIHYGGIPASAQVIRVRTSNNCGTGPFRSLNNIAIAFCPRTGAMHNNSDLLIHPNPAHDELQLYFTVDEDVSYVFQLVDMAGRMIVSKDGTGTGDEEIHVVDVKGVNKGIYILQVITALEKKQMKVVLE